MDRPPPRTRSKPPPKISRTQKPEGKYCRIGAQIAAGYALTLRLRHLWYLVTSTSGYGCPKNGTHPLYIPGQILVATAAESRLTDYQANGATDLLSLHGD